MKFDRKTVAHKVLLLREQIIFSLIGKPSAYFSQPKLRKVKILNNRFQPE